MKISKRMPAFEAVAAGQTATAKLPIGLSYHSLQLNYSGATLAQLNEIRVVVNGKVLQRYVEASHLDSMNKFDGQAGANGVINIPIGDRFGLKTRAGIELSKLGTGIVSDTNPATSIHVEVDIDAAAVNPALSLLAVMSDPDVSGLVKHVRQFTKSPTGAGLYEISDLPKGNLYNQIFFKSANIDKIEIERDERIVFSRTKAENDKIQNDGVRITQAGYFVVDLTEEGHGSESLVTEGVQDLRFKLTMAAADTVGVTVVSLGALGD